VVQVGGRTIRFLESGMVAIQLGGQMGEYQLGGGYEWKLIKLTFSGNGLFPN